MTVDEGAELMAAIQRAVEAFKSLPESEQRAHRREQAISFAYGQVKARNPNITREEVAKVLDEWRKP